MTSLQKKILEMADYGCTTTEIAETLHCSESTVKRVRANADLNRERNQASKQEISRDITESLAKVAKVLDGIISDPKERPEIKLQAAKLILDLSSRTVADEPKEDIHIKIEYV